MQKYKFIWALKKWTVYKRQIGFNLLLDLIYYLTVMTGVINTPCI